MEVVLSVVDEVIVTSTSLVIKMELVRVTESPATMEEGTKLLVTGIKLHMKTVEHTKDCVTYHFENRFPHKLFV